MKKLLFALALAPTLLFGEDVQLSRILIPVALDEPVAGAHGSQWTSFLTIHNRGEGNAAVYGVDDPLCSVGVCNNLLLTPGEMARTKPADAGHFSTGPGKFLFALPTAMDQLDFVLRAQDQSRQALTWGTEIPVVPESDSLSTTAQFLDVPTDSRFRQTLRVYEFDLRPEAQVRVRILSADGNLLATRNVSLLTEPGSPTQVQIHQPTDWVMDAVLPAVVRVEVEPVTPGLRFWAMINITNNETQHVTLISPE